MHALTHNGCACVHRSRPVYQQNSDQPEARPPFVDADRMMPGIGSKIVIPSFDVEKYSGKALCSIIS